MIPRDLESIVLQAVDETNGVMIVTSETGTTMRLYVNDRAAEILGWPCSELAANSLLFAIAPDERPRMERLIQEWGRGGTAPTNVETVYLAKDGRRVHIQVSAFDARLGTTRYAILFFADISQRVRATEALVQSEQRIRRFAETAPDVITAIVGGRFVWANHAAARILGFDSVDEFLARPMSELLDPRELALMADRVQRLLAGERMTPFEYHPRRKDGSTVALEISSIPVELGGTTAVLSIGRDLSERNRMQAELIRAERLASVGMLAAGVAHEINNPMTYTLLNLHRLRKRMPALARDETTRQELATMLDAAIDGSERVAEITRQLLLYTRIDVAAAPVRVSDAIDSALRVAQARLSRAARVVTRLDEDATVVADERRLTQVFVNLLLNATDAIGDAEARDNVVSITMQRDSDRVVVEVADRGPGIPSADLERVFEPFFTTKAAGTGLGLAISRSIVESFGGDIAAFARPGGGTSVRVRLVPAD